MENAVVMEAAAHWCCLCGARDCDWKHVAYRLNVNIPVNRAAAIHNLLIGDGRETRILFLVRLLFTSSAYRLVYEIDGRNLALVSQQVNLFDILNILKGQLCHVSHHWSCCFQAWRNRIVLIVHARPSLSVHTLSHTARLIFLRIVLNNAATARSNQPVLTIKASTQI